MESLAYIAIGATGLIVYNSFIAPPKPAEKHPGGTALPCPRVLYSDPAQWTGSPVDMTYRRSENFYGPGNDPRRRYFLPGGCRVVHNAYSPAWTQTNLVWSNVDAKTSNPAVPGYSEQPSLGIDVKKTGAIKSF